MTSATDQFFDESVQPVSGMGTLDKHYRTRILNLFRFSGIKSTFRPSILGFSWRANVSHLANLGYMHHTRFAA